jgi:transcriptional regulator with XRE-family HTH domain
VVNPEEIIQIRQKAISDLIHEEREKNGKSIEELAQQSGLTPESLQSYEQGEVPIPLPDLEILTQVLNNSIKEFEDQQGPVGNFFAEKRNINEFLGLPQEIKEFVSKPINRPYLEMAVRLSELKAERLRALAESLLEITL